MFPCLGNIHSIFLKDAHELSVRKRRYRVQSIADECCHRSCVAGRNFNHFRHLVERSADRRDTAATFADAASAAGRERFFRSVCSTFLVGPVHGPATIPPATDQFQPEDDFDGL
jgi:hypothetical protein